MTWLSRMYRIGLIVFVMGVGFSIVQYVFDARARATAHECYSSISHNGLYRAESCVTDSNGAVDFFVGKLYDARSGKLLARVDFESMDGGMPWFMPDDSAVGFQGARIGDTGALSIPPNWRDRLRAIFP